jgi:CopG family nickel-responsive transcriptional regulator
MKTPLVRFGVAMEKPLLEQFDAVVDARGATRSELLRDLARAEVVRGHVRRGVEAVAALTIVYDHHVRELGERLTEMQHELGDGVRATMHVHLSDAYCLEVIVMRGRSDELQSVADRVLATRGVKHGGIEIIANEELLQRPAHRHGHGHGHRHDESSPAGRRGRRKTSTKNA